MSAPIRILFLADTHLGFDLPRRPRVERRRRGHDFMANFERALEPARRGEVDAVVHGGDVFFRRRIPPALVQEAFVPICEVAAAGVPFFIVPGNHERSVIPYPMLATHQNVMIFDEPRTFSLEVKGRKVALSGFPYDRRGVRQRLPGLVAATRWQKEPADIRLLCMHHIVEGSTVGPGDHMFRSGPDVIRGRDLPHACDAILSGHIHRFQVLESDLEGRALPAPVFYPGSVERTSFAERDETKGYLILAFDQQGELTWTFSPLPARPMVDLDLDVTDQGHEQVEERLRGLLEDLSADAIVRVRVQGNVTPSAADALAAANLRRLAPPTMNIQMSSAELRRPPGGGRRRSSARPAGR